MTEPDRIDKPDRHMDPGFVPSSEADPIPGMLTVFWSFGADDDFGSAQRLADSFGGPVHEPIRWPTGARKPEYVLDIRNPVSPLAGVASYGIAAQLPGHPGRLIVTGRRGPSPHRADRNGWFAIPDLADVNGLVRDDGLVSHACVERDGHTVHVTMFPSVEDAVRTARGLRCVVPTESADA